MALQPGVVRDAITAYLRRQGTAGAKIADIHHAVNAAVGQDVAASSVRSYLRLNAGAGKSFEQVARGTYRLR